MLGRMRTSFVVLLIALGLVAASAESPHAEPDARAADYASRAVRGWTVQVERGLEREAAGERALELLAAKLFDVERAVPEPALAKLRAVPIWLSLDDRVAPCMCYHVSPEWLSEHGFDPRKAKGVEIANAARFVEWSREQPWMVLHELAHAYHDRELGHAHAGVRAAFERARAAKALESVLHWDGGRVKAYALENDQEFFAEASEAWFGTNDFWPFVRAELRDWDPEVAKLMQEAWGG